MFYKKTTSANAYNEYSSSVNYYRIRELSALNGLRRLEIMSGLNTTGNFMTESTRFKKGQYLLMKVTFS